MLFCPICQSSDCAVSERALVDNVLGTDLLDADLLICLSCGHGYLSDVLEGEALSQAYKGYYTQSALGSSHDPVFSYFKPLFRLLSKRVFTPWSLVQWPFFLLGAPNDRRSVRFLPFSGEHKSVLDVGCGNGRFLSRCRELGYAVKGIDVDPISVQLVRSLGIEAEMTTISDHNAQLVSSELTRNCKYDYVTSSHVIEHVANPRLDINACLTFFVTMERCISRHPTWIFWSSIL